jgi:hypothetical protein
VLNNITRYCIICIIIIVTHFTANDFTFSKQIKGKPVPYGEAGDCYSKSKSGCPQGRFSIDLTGTGMKISRDTTWVGKGSNTSIWVKYLEVTIQITFFLHSYYFIYYYRRVNLRPFLFSNSILAHIQNIDRYNRYLHIVFLEFYLNEIIYV